MKSFLISILLLTFLYSTIQHAQDIKAKLAGHQAANGFTVVDDDDNVLFKVTGDGNVGINTNTPEGHFHIFGGPSNSATGKPIKLIAQNGTEEGGYILLKGGYGDIIGAGNGDGGQIMIEGGKDGGYGGNVHIYAGDGDQYGGDVNISTSSHYQLPGANKPEGTQSQIKVGDINIYTGGSNQEGGKIKIYTEHDNAGGSGIEIFTKGSDISPGSSILIETGRNGGEGANIDLKTTGGGDIVITPHSSNYFRLNGNGIYTGNWQQDSDERYKENIEPIKNSLDKITHLNPINFEWKKDEYPDKNFQDEKQIGLIAQEIEKILPELVRTDGEGYKSIDYTKINVFLIEAIKEQQKSIEELKKEVAELRNKLTNDLSLNTPSNN
jgi:hypothetical protein